MSSKEGRHVNVRNARIRMKLLDRIGSRLSNIFSLKERGVRLSREFQPHALSIQETPPSPFTRIILWLFIALTVFIIVWSYFSRIPIMTSSPGKFSSVGSTKIIQSLNTGTVSHILVNPGETVRAGEPLVELNSTLNRAIMKTRRSTLAINLLEKKRILAEISGYHPVSNIKENYRSNPVFLLESQFAASELANAHSEIAYDESKIKEAEAKLEAASATFKEYRRRAAADDRIVAQAGPLVQEGALSEYHYDQLKDHALRYNGKLAAQKKQIVMLMQAVIASREKLDQDQARLRKELYKKWQQSQIEGYDLERKEVAAKQQYQLDWLRSPVNGVVQSVDVASLGAVIQAGQTVATIVPSDAPLIVVADVPSQDAGFIKPGQNVNIKVAAFPFEQYGMIYGRVFSISPTAESTETVVAPPPGENHQAPQSGSNSASGQSRSQDGAMSGPPVLYYRVRIQPKRPWLMIAGKKHFMQSGMTVTVDIQTGERSILGFFLAPIDKYINNGFYTQ